MQIITDEANTKPQNITCFPIQHSEEGSTSLTSSSCSAPLAPCCSSKSLGPSYLFPLVEKYSNYMHRYVIICQPFKEAFLITTKGVPEHTLTWLNIPSYLFSLPNLVSWIFIVSFYH